MTPSSNWGDVLSASFFEIWLRLVNIIPGLIIALIVLGIGVFIAKALGSIIEKGLSKMYVDRAVETTGLKKMLEKIGFSFKVSTFFGVLVKWFLYAVTLVVVAEVLGLPQISEFLGSIVLYIPNVIIAVVILVVGIVVGNFIFTLVKETATAAKMSAGEFLANLARWAILVFTVAAALIQLGIARELIQILFIGFVFMIALAGGLAFGLAGKDQAQRLLNKIDTRR